MKTFYWLMKREFWEHRGGFLWAPVITGGVFLLLNLMGIVTGEVMGGQRIGEESHPPDSAPDRAAMPG